MDKKINRNIVCSILFKDDDGNYHRIFQVEGDRVADYSIYFVKLNHVNKNVAFDEEKYRKFCLQKTFHSKVDSDGLVESHFKRSNNRFAHSKRLPLDKLNYILDFHFSPNDDIKKYPGKIPESHDILIKSKPEYLKDYHFIFCKGDDTLDRYKIQENLFIMHKYQIPMVNTHGHMLALAINLSRLIEIQSLKKSVAANYP
jgi:hypothetical protein